MIHKNTFIRNAQIAIVLLAALTLKLCYSSANVNELRWILAPTTLAVELISGARFGFESYAGYVNSDHSFVIAASCSGVNFLITAFLMLSLGKLWQNRGRNTSWMFFPCAAVCAYVATIVANTVRISTALRMHGASFGPTGLSQNQIHRFEGIFVYFGFLLLLFLLSEKLNYGDSRTAELIPKLPAADRLRRFERFGKALFPLLIYYATTLGIPLANLIYHRGAATSEFGEHFAFVLMTPLLFFVPMAILRWACRISSIHTR